jgi:hypothetical protein
MLCGHGTTGDHGWVEENPNAAEAEGLHIRPWQNPLTVRVLYRGLWAWLLEDGTVLYEREELAPEEGDVF